MEKRKFSSAFEELMSKRKKLKPSERKEPEPSIQNSKSNWTDGLRAYLDLEPSSIPNLISSNQTTLTISDAFPKAHYHYLVLPKDEKFVSLGSLCREDAESGGVLDQLLDAARGAIKSIEEDMKSQGWKVDIKMGFHAIPSMSHLHLHVISQDFVSDRLKHKKHYNSFTTPFFLTVKQVRKQLLDDGKVAVDKVENEAFLQRNLECHICGESMTNMPKLKAHLLTEFNKVKQRANPNNLYR